MIRWIRDKALEMLLDRLGIRWTYQTNMLMKDLPPDWANNHLGR